VGQALLKSGLAIGASRPAAHALDAIRLTQAWFDLHQRSFD